MVFGTFFDCGRDGLWDHAQGIRLDIFSEEEVDAFMRVFMRSHDWGSPSDEIQEIMDRVEANGVAAEDDLEAFEDYYGPGWRLVNAFMNRYM